MVDLVNKHMVPIDYANKQLKHFWLPDEPKVEKDLHCIMTEMTEAERHGVITVLKLFTMYELKAGQDYWLGRYMRIFPRHEYTRMASVFGAFELAVHKPFYSRINEVLGLANDEFYNSYTADSYLSDRMDCIDAIISDPDDLVSLAGFTFIEGAVLYSSFAFLKHFQVNGKNKILNIVRGINFSLRDENLHAEASAWSYREKSRHVDDGYVRERISELCLRLWEHEKYIIDMIFSKGEIQGITREQMYSFVQSRIDHCLAMLGFELEFHVTSNPIAEWFYDSSNKIQFNDKFTGIGASYHRDWPETEFAYAEYSV